jgi:type II secretory ATPase GspE/PulE/Tfp pilus assembly ATPase PilB-like protein
VNDAVGTVVRLLDMGIAPYCIAYALRVAVAQRFARRLCESCRKKTNPPEALTRFIPANRPVFTQGEGCKDCARSGYAGRIPLFELMPMSPALKAAVYGSRAPDLLQEVATKNGLISLFQDGIDKVAAGITSYEEVLRTTKGVRQPPTPKRTTSRVPIVKPAPGPAGARPAARPAAAASPRPAPRPQA